MITEMITGETINTYMNLLSNEEIFGIENERFTCFGACDEDTGEALGIITAEVYMEHIRIRRVFSMPKNTETEKALMAVITNLPEDMKLPVYYFGTDEEVDEELLLKCGFTEEQSKYSYIEGTPENLKEVGNPSRVCEFRTLDKAPLDGVQDFLTGIHPDGLLEVPDAYLDLNRFSDASLVAVSQHKIEGILLVEDTGDLIEVPYISARDNKVVILLFHVLKKMCSVEYGPKVRLRFVICDKMKQEAINALMKDGIEHKVRIFKYV